LITRPPSVQSALGLGRALDHPQEPLEHLGLDPAAHERLAERVALVVALALGRPRDSIDAKRHQPLEIDAIRRELDPICPAASRPAM
jgi:hypothetical protein